MLSFFSSQSSALTDPKRSLTASTNGQETANGGGLIDLIDLEDFNIQVARVESSSPIEFHQISSAVTQWMNDAYEYQLQSLGYLEHYYSSFDTVILLERKMRGEQRLLAENPQEDVPDMRELDTTGQLYTANFKGAALFSRNSTQEEIPAEVVHFIQENTINNKTGLLRLLKLSNATSLGALVVDINAFTVEGDEDLTQNTGDVAGDAPKMENIIIIAVVVAAVAFLFLLIAIFWAWRYDRRNREAYLVKEQRRSVPSNTNSTYEEEQEGEGSKRSRNSTPEKKAPVSVIGGDSIIGGGVYPESVISEDISTSLSQYYRSGLASSNNYSSAYAGRSARMDHLNDAASVSSMDSYGYSLDGYAPSAMTPMPADIHTTANPLPIGLQGDGEDEMTDIQYQDDDEDEDLEGASELNDSDSQMQEKF